MDYTILIIKLSSNYYEIQSYIFKKFNFVVTVLGLKFLDFSKAVYNLYKSFLGLDNSFKTFHHTMQEN